MNNPHAQVTLDAFPHAPLLPQLPRRLPERQPLFEGNKSASEHGGLGNV